MTTSPADGEIVSITTSGNHTTQSDATNGVRVVSAHTQVRIHPNPQIQRQCESIVTTDFPIEFLEQKKYILQAGTTSDGVSIIDVVPIDQSDSTDDAPITVSTIIPADSAASSPNSPNSQQITAQVAFVQAADTTDSDSKQHFITVNGM